jgi:hypothetical protein
MCGVFSWPIGWGHSETIAEALYFGIFGDVSSGPSRDTQVATVSSIRGRRASADDTYCLSRNLAQFGARRAGTGPNRDAVHGRRCEDCQRRWIGTILQLASVTRRAEPQFKIHVNHAKSRRNTVSNLGIFNGFRYRGADHKAAARAALAWTIDRKRRFVCKHQAFCQGTVLRKRLTGRGQADLPVVRQRLEIERALVAKRRIQARGIHPGRGSNAAKGSAGVAGSPEGVRRALQGSPRIIGARPATARYSGFDCFSCHVAKHPGFGDSYHICMERYKKTDQHLARCVEFPYLYDPLQNLMQTGAFDGA